MKKNESGIRLKEIRELLGLNQKEFSEILEIRQNYLSRYETGEHEFTDDLKLKLVEIVLQKFNKRVNLDWFILGKGDIFLENTPQQTEKDPLVREIEIIIDRNMKHFESRLAEIEAKIRNKSLDSDMFVSEPEPEYGEDSEEIAFVDNIAAGRPIYQSDSPSFISVPKRFIKTKPEDYYVGRIRGTSMTAAGIPDGVLVLIRISDIPRDGAIQVVERQGEATLKRMREIPGKGWKICFDDHTGRYIDIGPSDEFLIQGDFIAILPE
jgi:SOS-response transcriptional repressor LexA